MIYINENIDDIYKNDSCLRKDIKMKKITNIYNRFLPRSYTSKNFVSDIVVIEYSENITFSNCRFKNITINNTVKNICFIDCIIDNITLDNAVVRELKMTSCAVYNITSVKSSISNAIIHDVNVYNISGSYLIHDTAISDVTYSTIMMNDSRIVDTSMTYVSDNNFGDTNVFLNCEIHMSYFMNCSFESSYFYNCTIVDNYLSETLLDGSKSADSTIEIPMICPKEGSFIGYKQIRLGKYCYTSAIDGRPKVRGIAVLEIPEDAKRINAGSNKCRASKAKVLRIESFDGEELDIDNAYSKYTSLIGQSPMKYSKGEMVYPDSFDENRFNTCSNGIHFFMSREDAVHYIY